MRFERIQGSVVDTLTGDVLGCELYSLERDVISRGERKYYFGESHEDTERDAKATTPGASLWEAWDRQINLGREHAEPDRAGD